jgi:branched-chain amino acid transport system substrate-binding protein
MKKMTMRRLIGAMAGAAALLAASCALAEDTIKIGALLIDSGPLAGLKDSQAKAINLAIEQINAAGGAAGRKLEPVFITYAGTPDSAVDGATRAVQNDGALFLTGMDTSAVSPALSAKLASLNALMVEVFAQADALTGKGCNADYFRLNRNDSMLMNATEQFLKDKDIKKWDILAADYAAGRDAAEKFKKLVGEQGGSIGKVLFAPFGTADFGAKISELGSNPADGLYVIIIGSDAVNLAKQQAQFGLFKKYKMVVGNSFVAPQVLTAMSDSVLGVYETLGFVAGEPGDQAEAFVKAYQERYDGEAPAYTAADQYAAIQLMAAAIAKAGSTDVASVRSALAGLKMDTVLGAVAFRAADHQAARPVLVSEIVAGADGKPTYAIKHIFPGEEILPPVDPACKM